MANNGYFIVSSYRTDRYRRQEHGSFKRNKDLLNTISLHFEFYDTVDGSKRLMSFFLAYKLLLIYIIHG